MNTSEPRGRQIQPIDEGLDEPYRILCADILVQRFRQEEGLATVMAGDVRHAGILARSESRRNPFRKSFHTVCLIYASVPRGESVRPCSVAGRNVFTTRDLSHLAQRAAA